MARTDTEDDCLPDADLPVPESWMEDADLEGHGFQYSIRNPNDWVASGPLGYDGRGHRFESWEEAEEWARAFYGARFIGRVPGADIEDAARWAFLIRGPRGAQ